MIDNAKAALKEYSSRLHKLYPERIEKMILFGSMGRGEYRENSDIDILVIIGNGDNELKDQITDAAFDIMLKYGVVIEPAIFKSEEWVRLTTPPTSFTYCVLNEGKEL